MVKNKELVAYCGLYCGDCVKYKGNVSKLADELKSELSKGKFEKIATTISEIKDYKEFSNTLDILSDFKCEKGCREGGGTPDCEIKDCCQKNGYETCAECDEFMYCTELAGVPVMQCGVVSYAKELERLRKLGIDKWLSEKV
jgi:hypothetical protein